MPLSGQTVNIIRAKAIADWPDDFEMQRHTIRQQTEAAEQMLDYQTKLDQENPVINMSIAKALEGWPEDFEMQIHVFKEQMDAAPAFFEFKHPTMPPEILERIKNKAFSEWPGDFEMMLHVLREQVSAWEEIYC